MPSKKKNDLPLLLLERNDLNLTKLTIEEKDLGKNNFLLTAVANTLIDNTNLKILNISNNNLGDEAESDIIKIITHNKGITDLDISYNNITPPCATRIAKALKSNMFLQTFHMEERLKKSSGKKSCPRIATIETDAALGLFQNAQLSLCQQRKTDSLSFAGRNMMMIPKIICSLTNIRELDLSNNCLKILSSDLYQLIALEKLNLRDNLIRKIQTMNLSRLQNLTELNLANNLLTELPFCLNFLPLRNLDISKNLLPTTTSFPNLLLTERGANIATEGNYAHFHSENSLSCRLFLLGDRNSGISKMTKLLQGIQIVHDAFKFLPNADKMILHEETTLRNRTANIQMENWYPVSKQKTGGSNIKRNSGSSSPIAGKKTRLLGNSSGLGKIFRTPSDQNNSSKSSPHLNIRPCRSKTEVIHSSKPLEEVEYRTASQRLSQTIDNRRCDNFDAENGPDPSYTFDQISCWLFDSVSARAHKLLLCGSHNRVPCLLTFQFVLVAVVEILLIFIRLTNSEAEMIDNIMRLVRSVNSAIEMENPLFFIVGTYKSVCILILSSCLLMFLTKSRRNSHKCENCQNEFSVLFKRMFLMQISYIQ